MISSMIAKELKLVVKEKGSFFWLLIMPMIFIVLFGTILGNIGNISSISVNVIDQDQTSSSQSFISMLEQKSGYKMVTQDMGDYDNQIKLIQQGKETALLVLPKGFGSALQSKGSGGNALELYRDATADSIVAPLAAVIENIASSYEQDHIDAALASAGLSTAQIESLRTPPFQLNDHRENAESYDSISQVVPGYTVMFVFFVNISMIRRFMTDRESGMIARMRTTSMKPMNYLIGMWIPYAMIAVLQCTILLSFGHIMYGMHIGNLAAVATLIVVLALCGTAIGLALSMLVKNENMGMAFTQLFTMGGAALGGLWVPISLMPSTIQLIGKFTPQYWAQRGLQDVMIRGMHLSEIWLSLVVLASVAVVALIVALSRFNAFMKSAVA